MYCGAEMSPKVVKRTRIRTYAITAAELPVYAFVPSGYAHEAYDELVANGAARNGPTLSLERAKVFADTCERFIKTQGSNVNNLPQPLFVDRPAHAALLRQILAEINAGDLLEDSDERRSVDDENESSLSDFIDDAPLPGAPGPAPADSSDDESKPPQPVRPRRRRPVRRRVLDSDEESEDVAPKRGRAAAADESADSKDKGPKRTPQYGDDDFDY